MHWIYALRTKAFISNKLIFLLWNVIATIKTQYDM